MNLINRMRCIRIKMVWFTPALLNYTIFSPQKMSSPHIFLYDRDCLVQFDLDCLNFSHRYKCRMPPEYQWAETRCMSNAGEHSSVGHWLYKFE